ncbi:hypothetical protein GCM10010211_58670 [Streptomyces albospinus]|uniref:Transposase n=1 Tax=Streptomyces albospinus TaxID=285515 RepID=A0ABQ2VHX1_9ACTN|nr:hypothetical protein GCM10010211_58670 [Streptomyces albospinus]
MSRRPRPDDVIPDWFEAGVDRRGDRGEPRAAVGILLPARRAERLSGRLRGPYELLRQFVFVGLRQ